MLRQYRWQLIALVGAAVLLIMALVSRANTQQIPVAVVATADVPVLDLSPTATLPILATPETVTLTSVAAVVQQDSVPTFREAVVGQIQRINPLYADLNSVDADIVSLIFEGLIRINAYGEPVPALASKWVISRDGLEYVLTLRDDILWQDGTPFSADDVIYTMSLLSDPDFDGLSDLGRFWRTVETTRLASNLVRFRLTQPLASFLTTLTVGILPEHALRGTLAAELATHPINLTPIGTGPYQLEALRVDASGAIIEADLRVSPVFRQRPEGQTGYALDRLSFRMFPDAASALNALNTGAVDGYEAARTQREQLLAMPSANVYTTIAPSVGMLIFNWDEGDTTRFFTELRARVALQRGLNRSAPVEAQMINQAVLTDSPILPDSWAYAANLPYPATDPTEALNLLLSANIRTNTINDEATEEALQVSEIYAFEMIVPDDPALVALANEVAAQWSQLRLRVTVTPLAPAEYAVRLTDGRFQAAIVELPQGADPDPFPYWHVGQSPDGRNWGGAADDRMSELLERARRDANGLNRILLYRQFQELFIERAIAIPLYYPLFSYAVNTRVEGVQVGFIATPADRFRNIAEWTLR